MKVGRSFQSFVSLVLSLWAVWGEFVGLVSTGRDSPRRATFFLVSRQERRQRNVPRIRAPSGFPRFGGFRRPVLNSLCSDSRTGLPRRNPPALGASEGRMGARGAARFLDWIARGAWSWSAVCAEGTPVLPSLRGAQRRGNLAAFPYCTVTRLPRCARNDG